MNPPFLSIILPVYNQADHIRGVVACYLERLAVLPIRFELLLVVNGCRDDSLRVCQEMADAHPEVRVIHSVPGGWGLAVRLGIAAATGDGICYTNSARTTGDMLVTVLDAWLKQPDHVVKAFRYGRTGFLRGIGSWMYNMECRLLFGVRTRDVNGTPKCFPKHCARLFGLREPGDLVDAEFMAICQASGYPVAEVPILVNKRNGGVSTTTSKTAVRLLSGAWGLWWRIRHDG